MVRISIRSMVFDDFERYHKWEIGFIISYIPYYYGSIYIIMF